jgi:TRAP-type C4-dicarboxylate transport system permease small subunit
MKNSISFYLGSLTRKIEGFHRFLTYLSAAGMLMMLLPTVADVIARILFNAPISGTIEFTGLVMAFVIYMGVPYAQTEGAHVRVTFAVDRLSQKTKQALNLFVYLFSIGILGFFVYATGSEAIHSYRIGEYFFGSTRFPLWPSRALVAIGLILLSLQFSVDFIKTLLSFMGDTSRSEP